MGKDCCNLAPKHLRQVAQLVGAASSPVHRAHASGVKVVAEGTSDARPAIMAPPYAASSRHMQVQNTLADPCRTLRVLTPAWKADSKLQSEPQTTTHAEGPEACWAWQDSRLQQGTQDTMARKAKFLHWTMNACLLITLHIWDVLEEGNDHREKEHEANGEDQGPLEHNMRLPKNVLHVEVEAQLHQHSPAGAAMEFKIMRQITL